MNKTARQVFGFGKAGRLTDEHGVEIHANQVDALRPERSACGEPAHRVSDAAADVDHTEAIAFGDSVGSTNGCDDRLQELPHTATVVELLGEALHLGVHDDEKAVDRSGIENAVALWQGVDDADGFAISELRKDGAHIVFANRQALERNAGADALRHEDTVFHSKGNWLEPMSCQCELEDQPNRLCLDGIAAERSLSS